MEKKISNLLDGLDEDLKWEAPIWRLVATKTASLQELETVYSHDDVLRANAVLDFMAEVERASMPEIPKGKK